MTEEKPQSPAKNAKAKVKVVRDPEHPEASPRSGVIPPVETRFGQPGAVRNPGGYPKNWQPGEPVHALPGRWLGALSEASQDELEAIVSGGRKASTSKVAAARLILDAAYHDDANVRRKALGEILDRTQGKSTQTTITATVDARRARAREAMKSLTPEQLQELLEVGRRLGLVEGEANDERHPNL